MSRSTKRSKQVGIFDLGAGEQIHGELTYDRGKTNLSLFSTTSFNTRSSEPTTIRGTLNNLTKVTLIDCISAGTGSHGVGDERTYFADVFPHFVIQGNEFLSPSAELISQVEFTVGDAATLFYDFDAFGSVFATRHMIEDLVKATGVDRPIVIGDHPVAAYFTGKHLIFECETTYGLVYANHAPSWSLGGPRGVRIDNKIRVGIRFSSGLRLAHVIDRAYVLCSYFGLLIGRSQTLSALKVRLPDSEGVPESLSIYWSWHPRRKKNSGDAKLHPRDVLIDPIRATHNFCNVLKEWLSRNDEWQAARSRLFTSFAKQRVYGVNRLIAAANAFDILPASAGPASIQLDPELLKAKIAAKALFKELSDSPQRGSILQSLGRIGKSNLKQKIRFRAEMIISRLPDDFPNLLLVVDEAVDCRNYFVHGNRKTFDYSANSEVTRFFTDTLEFVFGASDLIEAGWDIREWREHSSTGHPFGSYRWAYRHHFASLSSLLPASSNRSD